MSRAAELIEELRNRVRAERRHGLENLERQWSLPILQRVEKRRAIGPLEILHTEISGSRHLCHFEPSKEDIADFREGSFVRISRDSPNGTSYLRAEFFGLTEKGLTVAVSEPMPAGSHGWTIDEDFVDLSSFYLDGIKELESSVQGQDFVLPVLTGEETEQAFDDDAAADAEIAAEEAGAENSQIDALASCVGAERYHLVQGPPGTGKTRVLALLVRELVKQNKRVLVTAFTHRAIHHALRQISKTVDCDVVKISDVMPQDGNDITFHPSFAESGLADHYGPYVVGITPISLMTWRGKGAKFDVAVIDEASQMRTEAAILPMLRADRWFFFGDQQQLPPVVCRPGVDAKDDSIFSTLARSSHKTMLRMTYRMNRDLTKWPSENFYHGELEASSLSASHRFQLDQSPEHSVLQATPSLVRIEVDHDGAKAFSHAEVELTAQLIEELLHCGLAPAEIGVVVPFRAQAAGIRSILRFDRFTRFPQIAQLTIDTVERFQGQERKIMIVNFVSSDPVFIENLAGFLVYPQRLNVAVTRAKTKVILIHSKTFRRWLERNSPVDENAGIALSLFNAATLFPVP